MLRGIRVDQLTVIRRAQAQATLTSIPPAHIHLTTLQVHVTPVRLMAVAAAATKSLIPPRESLSCK